MEHLNEKGAIMSKRVLVNVEANKTVTLDSLIPFQDDLKTITKDEYEKLRESTIQEGISLSLHVWPKGNKNNLIDGHQRVFTWKKMRDDEGFEMPEIPVSIVKAKSFKEAKRKVLMAASVSGRAHKDAVAKFLESNEISLEEVLATISIPGIDLTKHIDQAAKDVKETVENAIPSSSDGVKQIQLYFDSDSHEEFTKSINALAKSLGTENITDTVMECVRANYKALVGAD
jgi:hypothetical protein